MLHQQLMAIWVTMMLIWHHYNVLPVLSPEIQNLLLSPFYSQYHARWLPGDVWSLASTSMDDIELVYLE